MNKKGFTLVEIIIAITLITIIGTSTTLVLLKKENKNELSSKKDCRCCKYIYLNRKR